MEALVLLLVVGLAVLLVQVAGLKSRIERLERRVVAPASSPVTGWPAQPSVATPAGAPIATSPQDRGASPRLALPPRPERSPRDAGPLHRAAVSVRRWFATGNVPVKVGMLVLFAGVAALLDYASDQGWLRMPIGVRLAGIAALAVAALAFAWRQRERRRAFALSLQGGAIGVLLLVVFAAFRLYGLLSPGVAFGLSVLLVALAGTLAVRQDAVWLALLGLVAGFLAPLWLSTGEGNHVVLFSYYALLDAAIFAIAWFRSWRALNLLGFAFTFAIGTAWGVLDYTPADYATTQPFLLLFFAFYLLLPILEVRRRAPGRRDLLDGGLVFGVPLVAFSLQAGLLEGREATLAACAVALAAVYAALAWAFRGRERFRILVAPYAALAVGFATLAVPLAFAARATGCIFALEGAALCWLGMRQGNRLQQAAGAVLQALAAFVLLADGPLAPTGPLFANGAAMAALVVAVAGFASAWSIRTQGGRSGESALYYLWGLLWWLGIASHEIDRSGVVAAHGYMLLCVATGWVAAEVHRRLPAHALAWTAAIALPLVVLVAFAQAWSSTGPFAGHGWLAWAVLLAGGWRIVRNLPEHGAAATAHVAWWLAWLVLASDLLHHGAVRLALGEGWRMALPLAPWVAFAAALHWRPALPAPPAGARYEAWRPALQRVIEVVLLAWWIALVVASGDATPLPWVPLLNPLEVVLAAALVVLAASAWSPKASGHAGRHRAWLTALAAFVLCTTIVLRACHHWGGVPWSPAMFDTGLVQASLTVAWSVLGVSGWILGSRRGQRGLWGLGALLMAVVLAKLLLVDRTHLGNLAGILSFLAYGVLCTIVGYWAPAPPRTTQEDARLA